MTIQPLSQSEHNLIAALETYLGDGAEHYDNPDVALADILGCLKKVGKAWIADHIGTTEEF